MVARMAVPVTSSDQCGSAGDRSRSAAMPRASSMSRRIWRHSSRVRRRASGVYLLDGRAGQLLGKFPWPVHQVGDY